MGLLCIRFFPSFLLTICFRFFFGLCLFVFSFALYFWWMGSHPWFLYMVFLQNICQQHYKVAFLFMIIFIPHHTKRSTHPLLEFPAATHNSPEFKLLFDANNICSSWINVLSIWSTLIDSTGAYAAPSKSFPTKPQQTNKQTQDNNCLQWFSKTNCRSNHVERCQHSIW